MSIVITAAPKVGDELVLHMPVAKEVYRHIPVRVLEYAQDGMDMFWGEVEHSQTIKVKVDPAFQNMVGGEYLLVSVSRKGGYYSLHA